ncbi:MAG: AAA family ATPase [Elusimicrobiota bacterium]|jgi:MoxR-like ATPase|nr:AAA family ATPase [Elusimicrobiota bacterium]
MYQDIKAISEKVKAESEFIKVIFAEFNKVIIGQRYLLERLLIGILADGHILIEGVPGLAKTLAVKTLAEIIDVDFKRIQFTPDLLPADLIGTLIYNIQKSQFQVKKGPIFSNIILADEINRSPAKVQSALLEAMQEKQVTIGDDTFKLAFPFIVLATQNPVEQDGTYPLPEAQVDRFMLKLKITYPLYQEELQILRSKSKNTDEKINSVFNADYIKKIRDIVDEIYVDEKIEQYILNIIFATRQPENYKLENFKNMISYGASPRATISLIKASKAFAFISGRGFVTPEDVKAIGMDVLRHRVIISYEAEAERLSSEDIIRNIFNEIEIP